MNLEKEFMTVMENFKTICAPRHFKDREAYAYWLAQTYYFVNHSTPLLGFALPHLKVKGLQSHFEHHIGEEEKHDLLLIKDLEKMGKKVSDYPEHPMTQAFYQSQYYKIQFEGGTALMGYILFLEGLAVHAGKSVYQEIKDLHKGSVLFIKVHAEEDPDHLDRAIDVIKSLSPEEQVHILNNLKFAASIYEGIMLNVYAKNLKKIA